MVLQEKGRMIAILPASRFKALIESKVVNGSQFPLPLENMLGFEMKNHIGKTPGI